MITKTITLISLLVLMASYCHAEDTYKGIEKYKLVQCGINEASPNENEILNMYHAIFNRIDRYASLSGIFGCKKHFQPAYHYITGQKLLEHAIEERENGLDRVKGADHWEGKAFKEPYWGKDMEIVFEDEHTRFYREVR